MTAIPVKKIGLMSMIFLCLNGIVGSGLFLLPGQVDALVGKWGLFIYMAVAMTVMSIGWCYAQCASAFNRNGGPYLYAKEAFGDFIGFEVGLMRWVVGIIAWASLTSGFIVALGSLFPALTLSPFRELFTISFILLLALLNSFGATIVTRLSNVITLSKGMLLLFFVLCGLFAIKGENLFSGSESSALPTITSFGSAALIIFYAFSGFEALSVVAAETENPQRNIPIAMMVGILLSSLLYFVVQCICIGALGSDLTGNASPIVDVAGLGGGEAAKFLVSLAMIISIGGVIIASSFITPRSLASLSEEQKLLPILSAKNKFQVPVVATFLSSALACLVALSGSFVELVTISVVSRFVQHSTTSLAVFAFHRRGIISPFAQKWKRLIPVVALSSMAFMISFAELYQVLWGVGALFVGVPLYLLQQRLKGEIEKA